MKTIITIGLQQEFDLVKAFPGKWLGIKPGKWSITNVDCLECFWGDVRETELLVKESFYKGDSFVRYKSPCSCCIAVSSGTALSPLEYSEWFGPKICLICDQLLVVRGIASDI